MTGCVGSVASPPELASLESAEGKGPPQGGGKAPSGEGPSTAAAPPAGAASADGGAPAGSWDATFMSLIPILVAQPKRWWV